MTDRIVRATFVESRGAGVSPQRLQPRPDKKWEPAAAPVVPRSARHAAPIASAGRHPRSLPRRLEHDDAHRPGRAQALLRSLRATGRRQPGDEADGARGSDRVARGTTAAVRAPAPPSRRHHRHLSPSVREGAEGTQEDPDCARGSASRGTSSGHVEPDVYTWQKPDSFMWLLRRHWPRCCLPLTAPASIPAPSGPVGESAARYGGGAGCRTCDEAAG